MADPFQVNPVCVHASPGAVQIEALRPPSPCPRCPLAEAAGWFFVATGTSRGARRLGAARASSLGFCWGSCIFCSTHTYLDLEFDNLDREEFAQFIHKPNLYEQSDSS